MFEFLQDQDNGYIDVTMTYLWEAGRTENKTEFRKVVKEVIPNMKEEDFMKICEMFQEDVKVWAEKRGIEQGIE